MIYTAHYDSLVGDILLAAKDGKLIGLWIKGQKDYLANLHEEIYENESEDILIKAKEWLDDYFMGYQPSIFSFDLNPIGSDFQKRVWKILMKISYGQVTTYLDIAKKVAKEMGKEKMSAQAVGGAIGHNPISIIIPCHRVIGSSFDLVGYNGGVSIKEKLLALEGHDIKKFAERKCSSCKRKKDANGVI